MGDFPKYIIVKTEHGCEVAIVFDPMLDHSAVAGSRKVLSAGFCSFGIGQVDTGIGAYDTVVINVWGESVTLGIKSNPDDTRLLARSLQLRD